MPRVAALALAAALLTGACAGLPAAGPGGGARPPLKVALIPLRNASGTPDAGSIVTYLTIHELMRSDIFEPIEPGLVREVLISERTLTQEVGPRALAALREQLGADLVIMGVVEAHRAERGAGEARSSVAMTLMGTREAVLLWAGQSQVAGGDTAWAFQIGRLHTADQAARRVVADLVRQMEEAAIARKDLII